MTIRELIDSLDEQLQRVQNLEKSEKMTAYMKGKFAFYGVYADYRNAIQREWFQLVKQHEPDLWSLIRELWEKDEREFQMVAVDLLKKRPKKQYQIDDWEQFEWIITQKSWWDTVDLIASNAVGTYFRLFPEMRDQVISQWRKSDDFWLNRTCLIFQLKYKDTVDFELLTSLIEDFKWNQEFFIQKAIGWSLREYSKVNPEAVKHYLASSGLKGLAQREASKYLY